MRVSVLLLLLPLLAGCTDADWDHLTSFGHADRDDAAAPATVAAAAPAPAPGPAAPNAFCLDAARQDATSYGFDTATQTKVAARSYQQCVTIFGQN